MKPDLTIIGIKENNSNKNTFVPHYYALAKDYPNARVVQVQPRSVMFTREAFSQLDFWNLDSDFFYMEDGLSFTDLINYNGSYFTYFSEFMKVLRVAHSLFETEDMFSRKWTKNKSHLVDIYMSMLACEVIWISPVLEDIFSRVLPDLFSAKMYSELKTKFLVLPPPDTYKFHTQEDLSKDFSTLTFLWNHRFNAVKNPKSFFSIIEKFHAAHPKVPIRIIILSSLTEAEVLRQVPESLQNKCDLRPFSHEISEYEETLLDANITIGTSKVESFGISILESVKYGLAVLNLPCNQAFAKIVGPKSTFKEREMVDAIYRVYSEKKYREGLIGYNLRGLNKTIPDHKSYKKILRDRLSQVFEERLDKTSTKSPKLPPILKKLEKGPLTKPQVYELMGWKSTGSIVNNFWSDYYYALRKLGVSCTVKNGVLYYHLGSASSLVLPNHTKADKSSTSKGLF